MLDTASVQPKGTLDHHFYEGRKYRTDDLGDVLAHAAKSHGLVYGAGILLLCSILGNIYQGTLPHWKPYYIIEDSASGAMRVLGPAPEHYDPSQATIKRDLREFVETLRGISTDKALMRQRWTLAFGRVTSTGRKHLDEYFAQRKPLEQRAPILIEVLRLLPRTAHVWDVRWVEVVHNDKGERLTQETYSGLFTVEIREPRTEDQMQANPAGIWMQEWTWSKEN
jgi:type IV secretion system protein VirB5